MNVVKLEERACGLLLHPTSLPGPGDSGELGPAARWFVDFLADAGQRWWQMLPVAPTGYGNSPYSALSAFAGNPALISRHRLVEDGLAGKEALLCEHGPALRAACLTLTQDRGVLRADFDEFCAANAHWLDDYALYRAIKRAHGETAWTSWPAPLRDRRPAALDEARRTLAGEILLARFEQWRFDADWKALRRHAAERGVGLIGDIPIFVAHDSADVWQHRELWKLRPDGEPKSVAGVPPDYFSATGQRWGNPLYRWGRMRADGYRWWVERFRQTLKRFDAIRLDHFIGFQRFWEIPAEEPTAVRGRWMKGPGEHFFGTLLGALGSLPLIAEDLGAVTPAVTRLRRRFSLPGIRLLQFAFGTDPQAHLFLPHNYERRSVVYTGTHDNDTTVGWWSDRGAVGGSRSPDQAEAERQAVLRYLGLEAPATAGGVAWAMIRAIYASVADLAIVPVQDVLGLDNDARMNRPGVALGNWSWRLGEGQLQPQHAAHLRHLAETYQRLPPAVEETATQPTTYAEGLLT